MAAAGGLIGVAVILGLAWSLSEDRRAIRWQLVGWGLILQVSFAVLVLKVPYGQLALKRLAASVTHLINFADNGSNFVFGWLVTDPDPNKYIFAFKVLPIVVFISSLFGCLYYLGVMQWIVWAMAKVMSRFMGVSGAESLAAAANVFMGHTEAPIIIAPYIPNLTYSELMALMSGGMATVSGAILGGYIGLGVNAEHLIAASVMAAPASLVIAKMMVPERGHPKTAGKVELQIERAEANLIEAAAKGAQQGAKMAINIGAMLVAFVSLIYLLNGALSAFSESLFGVGITLQQILGYLLAPLAFSMGVPWGETVLVGQLIGLKVVLNEFIAYVDLVEVQGRLSSKSQIIATYALCGFANLSSVGMLIGGIGGLAPSRRTELAKLGLKALVSGSLASFLSATVAGMLLSF